MTFPDLGIGVGLRAAHFDHILAHWPQVDWFEIITENFCDTQGWPRHVLDRIAERYPIALHGVSLSIGGADPLDFDYLRRVKRLATQVRARWISDHLCWTGVAGRNTHDLLPLLLCEEALAHVVERVRIVQDFLAQPLLIENPSAYANYTQSTLNEWEFVSRLVADAGCYLLLDVNNVYVSAFNLGFDPEAYLTSLPHRRIAQIHLAGHDRKGSYIVDTHDREVADEVWSLYARTLQMTGPVSTSIEWDDRIPPFPVLHDEARKAARYRRGLRALQQSVQEAITAPEPAQAIGTLMRGHPEVYRTGYRLRLAAALREQLPLLRSALGDDLFDRFADEYIDQHPPTSYTLEQLDRHFVQYLCNNRPDRDADPQQREFWPDLMIDLVRLDQVRRQVFHGDGGQVVAEFSFPLAEYAREALLGHRPQLPAPRPTRLRVFRKDFRVYFREEAPDGGVPGEE